MLTNNTYRPPVFNPNIIQPFRHMAFIKTNNWYYKPHSQPSCGVGGSCNRAVLNRKKKRT